MQGIIIRSTGSWYDILTEEKSILKGRLRGKFKIQGLKVTNPIAVGDRVVFEIEKGAEQSAFITDILPRENYIIRKSVHKTGQGHLIAANIDQLMLIATLVFPRTSLGFIDRFLVTAETFRIPAVLVFNKYDLFDEEVLEYFEGLKKIYEPLGYKVLLTSAIEKKGLEELESLLLNKKTLVSGHSGVGKSSLINAISPNLNLKTSEISDFSSKGVHTTTFAEMFEIKDNTFIIDTPGIKELGLMDVGDEELSHYFPEMRTKMNECKFHNCRHLEEPKCAVRDAVEKGEIALSRYESYLSILQNDDNRR